jgi:hypothetical protein
MAAAAAADGGTLDASATLECRSYDSSSGCWQLNSTGTNSNSNSKSTARCVQQQLLGLLSKGAAADAATATATGSAAALSVGELALLRPAWPHLQELDLSGGDGHLWSSQLLCLKLLCHGHLYFMSLSRFPAS